MKVKFLAAIAGLALTAFSQASAAGWPSKYEGVMLQGFYWDSYNGTDNTKWVTLTNQADELAESFKLIWVPNSAKCASSPSNGYDPVYWFTNHNSSFGTESQLKTMVSTFKNKGVGIIEDVVVNHRSGVSNWTNFPAETWNGKTYKLGPEHICSTDEVKNASGQAKPTGAPDTGEDFNGSRDLDHTSLTVQDNVKNYCKFLLEELGYAGFRLDMCKGYGGQYTKIYNQYSKPTFSVGEYWDGSYDAVAAWIESTGKESAAFDYPLKYCINDAFYNKDYTKLVWKALGTTDQPAGMIHYGYNRYSVTFIDNHDTYRDGYNKFNGNIVAANAFILCSPGTPCIFWKHWSQYKSELKKLIAIRNAVGVHNESSVRVLKTSRDCYMAEVTGTKGTLVVKIGSTMDAPSGYSNADIKATGTDYCVWSKVGTTPTPDPVPNPGTSFDVYFDNTQSRWATPYIYYWPANSPAWPGVSMTKHKDNVWKYTVPAGTTGIIFNAGDGDATKTADLVAYADHLYTTAGDQGVYNSNNPTPDPVPGNYPEKMYLIGNINGQNWDTTTTLSATHTDGVYIWNGVKIDAVDTAAGVGYFSFITTPGSDWDAVNGGDRYGATSKDCEINIDSPLSVVKFPANVNASAATSWKAKSGQYQVKLNLKDMLLTISAPTSVIEEAIEEGDARWFNLQGVEVAEPTSGLYIKVTNGKTAKVLIP